MPVRKPPKPVEKRSRGHPQHVPDDKSRSRVTAWSGGDIEQKMIAASLKISVPTLRRHYKAELLTGKATMNGLAISALGAAMRRGGKEAVVAAKWWTQSRMGWSERITVVDGGTDIDPATLSDTEIEARLAKLKRSPAVLRAAKSAGTVH